jgi:hypothetical protein
MSFDAAAKNLGMKQNVLFRVLNPVNNKVLREYKGHNQATNSLLTGIAHYLRGDGVYNQSVYTMTNYIPAYISLGTMGLINQDEDDEGLPAGLGVGTMDDSEIVRFTNYMNTTPGYGSDGYDPNDNNERDYFGLGPMFTNRPSSDTVNCELISTTFHRSQIVYRNILPENESELPETLDVVFSAMISTGALAQFRPAGKDYLFITEAGLWSSNTWIDSADNGLLAGYRLAPPDESDWDMTNDTNRHTLKTNILRVGINEVVQVIWKIQVGSLGQFSENTTSFPDWIDGDALAP